MWFHVHRSALCISADSQLSPVTDHRLNVNGLANRCACQLALSTLPDKALYGAPRTVASLRACSRAQIAVADGCFQIESMLMSPAAEPAPLQRRCGHSLTISQQRLESRGAKRLGAAASRPTALEEFLLAALEVHECVCSSGSSYSTGGSCHLTECCDQCSL